MLSKEIVEKLPVEQQEVLAQLEVCKGQHRQKLLDEARGRDWRSRWFPLYIFGIFLLFLALYYFGFLDLQKKPAILFMPLGMVVIFTFVGFIAQTDRRLNALAELLELDREKQEKSKAPSESKTF
jgi:hypothetical protein